MSYPLFYSILKHERLTDMCDHVNRVMREGWVPLGGVTLTHEPADMTIIPMKPAKQYYIQAVQRIDIAYHITEPHVLEVVK